MLTLSCIRRRLPPSGITAETGGSISGQANQIIIHGGDGAAVNAVPDTCYNFINWSDGFTSNPRQDINVTSNISVSAVFEKKTYTLS